MFQIKHLVNCLVVVMGYMEWGADNRVSGCGCVAYFYPTIEGLLNPFVIIPLAVMIMFDNLLSQSQTFVDWFGLPCSIYGVFVFYRIN
jgi:hypothetical protein